MPGRGGARSGAGTVAAGGGRRGGGNGRVVSAAWPEEPAGEERAGADGGEQAAGVGGPGGAAGGQGWERARGGRGGGAGAVAAERRAEGAAQRHVGKRQREASCPALKFVPTKTLNDLFRYLREDRDLQEKMAEQGIR